MLRVVEIAAWDWELPHMSGYPHLPPPATTVPATSCVPSTPALVPPRPAVGPLPAAAAPPPPPASAAWRAAAGPPALSALWRAPLRNVRAAGASTEGAAWPVHRCGTDQEGALGGCGTNLIVRPPLRLSMRGLYGAVSHMYVDPRSRLPNVLHLGGPLVFPQDPQETSELPDEHSRNRRN